METELNTYPYHSEPTKIKKNKLQKKALQTAKTMLPRVYRLTNRITPDKPLRILVLGCQGSGNEAQKKVAQLMATIAEDKIHRPDFILLLGDNIYHSGAKTPSSSAFKKVFEEVYLKYPTLKTIPFFVILGNHDESLHTFALNPSGLKRGFNEVARTYFFDAQNMKALFERGEIPLNKTSNWLMPSPFYALDCGNAVIFCINSNHYISDFLEAELDGNNQPDNQACWLKREAEKAKIANKKIILALHHPLVPLGRREYLTDFNFYFKKKAERDRVMHYFGFRKRPSYNQLLRIAFEKQQLAFDMVLAAHDHILAYYNNTDEDSDYDDTLFPLRQLILGGGGGVLQSRLNFKDQAYLGCFLKRYGFAEIEISDNGIYPILHTIAHQNKLHFSQRNCHPIRNYQAHFSEKILIEQFCQTIKLAIDDYLGSFINLKQETHHGQFFSPLNNISHGGKGVDRAHEVWTYISEYMPDDLVTTVSNVYKLANYHPYFGTKPHTNSFINKINKRLNNQYGKNLEDLYLEICKPQQRNKHPT